MIGTLVNVATVIIGGTIGVLFHSKVPKRFIDIAFTGIGIFTLILGVSMAIQSNQQLFMVFSIIIGSIIGEGFDLDRQLNRLSERFKERINSKDSNFSTGLITSFLLFCMGSMTILGAIQEGVSQSPDLLLTKATMDGFAALALASTLGIGVIFSVIPLFIFQGGLTLLAGYLQHYLTDAMITELSAVGGLLLIALALNILEIKTIKVMNMLPSLLVIIIFMVIHQFL
ncbi:DUF554 domain-containing protein [Vallitaleaceae bacterium 9-2]